MCKALSYDKKFTYDIVYETARHIEEKLGLRNPSGRNTNTHSDKISKYFAKKREINNSSLAVCAQQLDSMSETEVTPDPESEVHKDYTPGKEEPIEVRQAIAGLPQTLL